MEAYRQEAYRSQPFNPAAPMPGAGQGPGGVPVPGGPYQSGQYQGGPYQGGQYQGGPYQGGGQLPGGQMPGGQLPGGRMPGGQLPGGQGSGGAGPGSGLDWLLDDLVNRVAHIQKAVILSQDGIALGASRALEQADAEHLAALAAGFQSLARGAGHHFGGGAVRQTIIEMEAGFLFVTAAGNGTCLAVLTEAGADVGLVAYEMAVLVQRTGEHLQTGLRGVPAGTYDT
jgi:predicted regulator of Ras-like GTPase activity (Roadblock/LC7/MglB family)